MSARWKTASTACGVSALQAGVIIGDFSAFPDESSIFSAIHLLNSVELSIFATTYNEHLTSFNGATCKFCAEAAFKGAKCLL